MWHDLVIAHSNVVVGLECFDEFGVANQVDVELRLNREDGDLLVDYH